MPRQARRQVKRRVKPRAKGPRSQQGAKQAVVRYRADRELLTYMPSSQQPLPSRYRTKFTASAYGSVASGAGSGDFHISFPFNSMFAPFNDSSAVTWNNITPSTFQPTGFNQLINANTYRQYRVYGCAIKINLNPQSVLDSVTCAITPALGQTNPTNVAIALAQPFTKSTTFTSGRAFGKDNMLHNYVPLHRLIGCTARAVEDDLSGSYTAAYNGNPGVFLFWNLNCETPDNSTFNQALEVQVELTYYAELWDIVNATLT